jgi:hypothetical protein
MRNDAKETKKKATACWSDTDFQKIGAKRRNISVDENKRMKK